MWKLQEGILLWAGVSEKALVCITCVYFVVLLFFLRLHSRCHKPLCFPVNGEGCDSSVDHLYHRVREDLPLEELHTVLDYGFANCRTEKEYPVLGVGVLLLDDLRLEVGKSICLACIRDC